MKIISKRGRQAPPPTADGIWPFKREEEDIDDEELSGEDIEVLRKTVPDFTDLDPDYVDFYTDHYY